MKNFRLFFIFILFGYLYGYQSYTIGDIPKENEYIITLEDEYNIAYCLSNLFAYI